MTPKSLQVYLFIPMGLLQNADFFRVRLKFQIIVLVENVTLIKFALTLFVEAWKAQAELGFLFYGISTL